ncbi:DUF3237 domain-containing protein [Pseudonocardia nigra]|uniref:DUF3237 domain-containing protein n=1 Tax=Pseudonocardia nigra TaxID=1921578 RepID=UPI001C5F6695|nr:DUF3237 domain-containing protein [Pseudonocardia nigra]
MPIELEPLGTLTISIEQQTVVRGTPQGGLLIGEAADCRWEGDRVWARQLGRSASDWVRFHSDGSMGVDARILLRTDDGATIAMTYRGRAARPPGEGGIVYTAPTFETDDERYGWLNAVQAVGKGQRTGNTLVYELYALR